MEQQLIEKIRSYKHAGVVARLRKEFGMSEDEASELFEDTKLFLCLSLTGDSCLSPTAKIDDGWHTFLLFTKDYALFCRDYLGHFVHHVPFGPDHMRSESDTQINIRELAASQFGIELSSNWGSANAAFGDCAPEPNCEAPPADCALNFSTNDALNWPVVNN